MKLRNKRTGEVKNFIMVVVNGYAGNNTLAEINEDWEDYEKTEYYFIDGVGIIRERRIGECEEDEKARKIIGNYFEIKEEAEKAVEKLKAWKRLKDKGFKTRWFTVDNPNREDDGKSYIEVLLDAEPGDCSWVKDIDLLFGGEE